MKITVYIPAHNYARYIEKAIDSVLIQTIDDWELIIINDGSIDDTAEVIKKYNGHRQIRIIEQEKKGLNVSNNIALRLSNAKYIMRLDADDYLDENALAVLSNILDTKPEIGLVYSDYYLADEKGDIIEQIRRKKIGEEVELLDLPAHGACTMFRRECLLELGGYNEQYDCQDGYELWLKFLLSFRPYNVSVPLFYYRQHHKSLTRDSNRILETRRKIKRNFVEVYKNNCVPKVLAVIPIIKQPAAFPDSAFRELSGKPLIWYTLSQVSQTKLIDKIVVSSNDADVLKYSASFEKVALLERPDCLTKNRTKNQVVVKDVLSQLIKRGNYRPDAVMILYINTPLRKVSHIEKAIDTMTIFGVDSVISVEEELAYCYTHSRHGLNAIQKHREMRLEKEAIYKENGAIMLSRTDSITDESFFGKKIGHIIMLPEESIRIKSSFSLWQAEKILKEWSQDGSNAQK